MQAFDGEHPAQHILNLQATSSSWPIHLPLPSRVKEADDETLIRLVTQGSHTESQSALEAIYVRHHRDVWRYVRSRLSSATDADEVAAGVWVVVIEKIYDFVWTGTPIKSWLLSIAHRKVCSIRRETTVSSHAFREPDTSPALHKSLRPTKRKLPSARRASQPAVTRSRCPAH